MEVRAPTRGGFTFVEIAAGILVLAIAIAATSSLISNGMMAMRANGQDLLVQQAATREMERLKSRPWSEIVAIAVYPSFAKNFCTDAGGSAIAGCLTGLEGLGIAQGRVYVQDIATGLRRVTVSVSVYGGQVPGLSLARLFQPLSEWFDPTAYAGGGPMPRSVWRLVTYISQNGINTP